MTGNSPTSPGSLCAVVLILPCYPWDQGLSLTGTSQTCSPPPLPPRPTTPFPSPTVVDATSAIFFARTLLWRQHVCVCAPWTGWWSKAGAGHTVGHGPQDPDLNHGQRGLLGTRPTMQRGLLGTRPTMQRGLLDPPHKAAGSAWDPSHNAAGLLGTRPTMQRCLLGTRPTMQRPVCGSCYTQSHLQRHPAHRDQSPFTDTQRPVSFYRHPTHSDQSSFTDTQRRVSLYRHTATSLPLLTPSDQSSFTDTQRRVSLYRHPTHSDQSSFTDTQWPVFRYRHPATSFLLQTHSD